MAEQVHLLMGDKLHVFRREQSPHWQCATWLAGKFRRHSTREGSLEHAKKLAEEWYLTLHIQHRSGDLKGAKLFRDGAAKFEAEYSALVAGERNARYVKNVSARLKNHILPFMGDKPATDITSQIVQDYRVHRMTSKKHPKTGEVIKPAKTTLHQEIVTIRHVLKTCERAGWIRSVPNLSSPYKKAEKISHRAWFSHDDYKRLYTATRQRVADPVHPKWKWESEQLHDFVIFMVNTGLRPDEALRLQFRDVEVVRDRETKDTILEISVRGKRGVGYCKSMPAAVFAFERLRSRKRAPIHLSRWSRGLPVDGAEPVPPKATDLVFPTIHRQLFNTILGELDLKRDREGQPRSAYSLRHTYICFRLMEGADIYAIAKNCRTSVEMIEKYYASHIKDMIDASAVNVRRGQRTQPIDMAREANAGRPRSAKSGGYPMRRR